MLYTIKSDRLAVSIASLGAEPISLRLDGEEYLWQGEQWKRHAPLLFPIICRVPDMKYTYRGIEYPMPNHGFARDSEFSVLEHRDDRLVLVLSSDEQTYKFYPFSFLLTAEYSVLGDTLFASFTVKNTGDSEMLYMFGWHPAFCLPKDYPISSFSLDFCGAESLTHHILTEDNWVSGALEYYPLENGIKPLDEEELYSQDTLIFSDTRGCVRLLSPDGERLSVSYSDNLPYLAVWKWPSAEARYICIEPWSGIAGDGVYPENFEQKKVLRLSTGESERFTYAVKCK